MNRLVGAVALVLFVASVWVANYLVEHVGLVSVGWGLVAPAGVYVVGVALVLRDIVQRSYGKVAAAAAILAGAGLSYFISPSLAVASAAAFLVSEAADMAVYTPMERDAMVLAVVMSGIVSAAVDSLVFLQLAFGDTAFFPGQFVGKVEMALVGGACLVAWRIGSHRTAFRAS